MRILSLLHLSFLPRERFGSLYLSGRDARQDGVGSTVASAGTGRDACTSGEAAESMNGDYIRDYAAGKTKTGITLGGVLKASF